MKKFPAFRIAAALALTSLSCAAHRIPLDDAGSLVEITSVFETLPPTGYAPIRVKLVNNTNAIQSASIRNTSRTASGYGSGHELDSNFSVTAQIGTTVEKEFLVPLCAEVSQSSYRGSGELRVVVQAGNRTESFDLGTGGDDAMQFTAFSRALAQKSIADINKAGYDLHSSKSGWGYTPEKFATLYTAAMLPSEWRGYSGLDVLAITADEWIALQPAVRTAILQWVKLGGMLDVFSKENGPKLEELGIKAGPDMAYYHGGRAHPLGNGMVCAISWGGAELGEGVARFYTSTLPSRQWEYTKALETERIPNNAGSMRAVESPLVRALGEKSFAAWQVGLILFVFGIMVGPVNLFYFARAGRRHRLFYTTPIISVAAAALLLLVIFFQDGSGGEGHRASVVYLDAAENSAFIHQVQVSRTGVLFGGTFTLEEPAVVSMVVMPNTRWTRLKSRSSDSYSRSDRGEGQRYSVSDKSYGGDWFQSRTEQAQIIDAVQSTRGRIELKSGSATPAVTSTLTASLDRLYYLDAQEKFWSSPGKITTGAAVSLQPATLEQFQAWREEAVSMLPATLRSKFTGSPLKGNFYAVSSEAVAGMVNTLDSIDWESDRVFLHGPLH